MDNPAFHKSQQTVSIINNAGCSLVYLPPYAPDFNPIEIFGANLKRTIRGTINKFKTLQEAIDRAFQGVV